MESQALAESRGRLGIYLLDVRNPTWFTQITEEVRVASTKKCTLAQLYGTYRLGRLALGLTDQQSLEHGFRAESSEFNNDTKAVEAYYDHLSAVVNREIERRLQAL